MEGSDSASSSYELKDVAAHTRRQSAGQGSTAPLGFTGFTPLEEEVGNDNENIATVADVSTYDISGVSRAQRRPSRGAVSEPFRPLSSFGGHTFTTMPATPPSTPPATPPEFQDEASMAGADKFAPSMMHSLPPTPSEQLSDPFGSDSEAEEGRGSVSYAAEPSADVVVALPPVDRGRHAWGFLIASVCIEGAIWGLPFSVGVLHEYWTNTMFPDQSATQILTLASTLNSGLLFFSGALLGPLFTAFPWYEKHIQLAGLAVSVTGLVASAFVTQPWQLLVTFGLMYPCSAATYLPCATNIFEWFVAKRGLATGIMYGGTGAGGMIYPFVVTALLKALGFRNTMLAIAGAFLAIVGTGLVFTDRRVPLPRAPVASGTGKKGALVRPKPNLSFLRGRAFWIAFAFMVVSSLGNFLPSLWTPTFAFVTGAQNPNGAALISIMNGVSIVGNLASGAISDHVQPRWCVTAYSFIAAVACLALWGMGTSTAALTGFAIVWGASGQSLAGTWARCISTIAGEDPVGMPIVFSLFISIKGIGAFVSGPISTQLLKAQVFDGAAGAYGSTNYGVLIIFTAAMTFVGALPMFAFPKAPPPRHI